MLVDNDENVLNALERVLNGAGERPGWYKVEKQISPIKAVRRVMAEDFDLFIADFRMPEMDGVAFLMTVKEFQPDAARIILTGHPDVSVLMGAINEAGIAHFLCKPWDNDELLEVIGKVLAQRQETLQDRYASEMVRTLTR
jgi:DNA-binding NtrC family response regulator